MERKKIELGISAIVGIGVVATTIGVIVFKEEIKEVLSKKQLKKTNPHGYGD